MCTHTHIHTYTHKNTQGNSDYLKDNQVNKLNYNTFQSYLLGIKEIPEISMQKFFIGYYSDGFAVFFFFFSA